MTPAGPAAEPRCPVCGSGNLAPFLERLDVPAQQNVVYDSADEARAVQRGDLRLAACPTCSFVTNTRFDPSLLRWDARYDGDQGFSPLFDRHLDGLVEEFVGGGLRGKRVVSVGCGRGEFLRRLCVRGDNTGFGFDKAYVGPETDAGGRARFFQAFFDESQSGLRPDVVFCRHVLQHIPDPVRFLASIWGALREAPRAVLHCEAADVMWSVDRRLVHDFFYEQCSYYTADALEFALVAAGFSPSKLARVFGEQYLLASATRAAAASRPGPVDSSDVLGGLARCRDAEREALERQAASLAALAADGGVAVWGAGAKGVTFLNLLDPRGQIADCVVDVNPRKQGRFVSGSAHPILAPQGLRGRRVGHVLVMNPRYKEEIRATVAGLGIAARVHADGEA